MNGDYIELDAGDAAVDVQAVLIGLLNPVEVSGGERTFPIFILGARTEMFIDDFGDGRVRLAITDSFDDESCRRTAAHHVYDALARHTQWALRWTADEPVCAVEPTLPGQRIGAWRAAATTRLPRLAG